MAIGYTAQFVGGPQHGEVFTISELAQSVRFPVTVREGTVWFPVTVREGTGPQAATGRDALYRIQHSDDDMPTLDDEGRYRYLFIGYEDW